VSKLIHHHEGILTRGVEAFFKGYRPISVFQKELLGQMVLFGGVEKEPLFPPRLHPPLGTLQELSSDSSSLEPGRYSNGKDLGARFPFSVSRQSPNHHKADRFVPCHGKEGEGHARFKPPVDCAIIRPIEAEEFSAQPGEEIFVGLFCLADRGVAFQGEKEV